MLCLITYKVRSENGYGFLKPGLKTGVGNGIFWSEIGSGFGDAGGTVPLNVPRSTPPPHRSSGRIENISIISKEAKRQKFVEEAVSHYRVY